MMEILSVFKAVLTPEKDQTAESFAFLKPGDKLIGKVLRLEADGRVLIDLGRVRALARTTVPVQVGQQLPLKVIHVGQPIQLRLDAAAAAGPRSPVPLLDPASLFPPELQQQASQMIDRLLALAGTDQGGGPAPSLLQSFQTVPSTGDSLPKTQVPAPASTQNAPGLEVNFTGKQLLPEPVRHALMQLKAALEPLALDAPVARQTEWVQAAVENRGMLFEVKLAHILEQSPAGSSAPGQPAAAAGQSMPPVPNPASPPASSAAGQENSAAAHALQNDNMTGLAGERVPQPQIESGQRIPAPPAGRPLEVAAESVSALFKEHAPAELQQENGLDTGKPAAEPPPSALNVLARDLKPQLLLLKSYLNALESLPAQPADPVAKETALLRQVVERLLSHVEEQQQHAVRRAGASEVYQVFTHVLPIKDQSMPVKLKVYYPNKGGPARDDPMHRIALLLDMDRLGMVRADLSMIERHLRIQFFVRDQAVQSMFAGQTPMVAKALEPLFDQVMIETQISKEKIECFDGEDLMGPPLGRIDLKA